MLDYIFSIPLSWMLPNYSFYGVFIYLTIKSLIKYSQILFNQTPDGIPYDTPTILESIVEDDHRSIFELLDEVIKSMLSDAKKQSICFLLKLPILLPILLITLTVDLGRNLLLYITILLPTAFIFFGFGIVLSTILNIRGGFMIYVNLISVTSALLLWAIRDSKELTNNELKGVSPVSIKELTNK